MKLLQETHISFFFIVYLWGGFNCFTFQTGTYRNTLTKSGPRPFIESIEEIPHAVIERVAYKGEKLSE